MKPCESCPFRPEARLGLWAPEHYLAIAYLGSADGIQELALYEMGCHRFKDRPHASPPCAGWVRAARNTVQVRLAAAFGRTDENDVLDTTTPILSPEEMALANGLDVDRLPPLRWRPRDPAWPTHEGWVAAILDLRRRVLADPELAWDYVVPGSPLDMRVPDEEIERILGPSAPTTTRRPRCPANPATPGSGSSLALKGAGPSSTPRRTATSG